MKERMKPSEIQQYIADMIVLAEQQGAGAIAAIIEDMTASPAAGSLKRLNESLFGPDVLEDITKLSILEKIYFDKVGGDAETAKNDAADSAEEAAETAAKIPGLLANDNALDVIMAQPKTDKTAYGITYTWNADGTCVVTGNGDNNNYSTDRIYYNTAALPVGIHAGGAYRVVFSRTKNGEPVTNNPNYIRLQIRYYDSDGNGIGDDVYVSGDTTIIVPNNAVGMLVRLFCANDADFTVPETVTAKIMTARSFSIRELDSTRQHSCDDLIESGVYFTDMRMIDGAYQKVISDFPYNVGYLVVYAPSDNRVLQFAYDYLLTSVAMARTKTMPSGWSDWKNIEQLSANVKDSINRDYKKYDWLMTEFVADGNWYNRTGGRSNTGTATGKIPVEPERPLYGMYFGGNPLQAVGGAYFDASGKWLSPILFPSYKDWQPGTAYNGSTDPDDPGDVVFYDDKFYSCVTEHTSGSTFNPSYWTEVDEVDDLGATVRVVVYDKANVTPGDTTIKYAKQWQITVPSDAHYIALNQRIFASSESRNCQSISTLPIIGMTGTGNRIWRRDDPARAQKSGKTLYIIGQSGVSIDRAYRTIYNAATKQNEGLQPIVGWQEYIMPYYEKVISLGFSGIGYRAYAWIWQPHVSYRDGDLVTYRGKGYECTTDHDAGDIFDGMYWNHHDTWNANTEYAMDSLAIHSEILYKCKTAHTSGDTWDAEKWDVASDESIYGYVSQNYFIGAEDHDLTDADEVFLNIGTNNVTMQTLGTYNSTDKTTMLGAINLLIDLIQARAQKAIIYIETLPAKDPVGNERRNFFDALNDQVRLLASYRGLILIDRAAKMGLNSANSAFYSYDSNVHAPYGAHFNNAGNRLRGYCILAGLLGG